MSRSPVVISGRAFEEGMQAGALKRTRRAADAYADAGDYDAAARETFQTDPELSSRYRDEGERTAAQAYAREVAPMVAQENYVGAMNLAGQRGRPVQEVLNFRQLINQADDRQRAELQRQLETHARSLLGIAELPAEQQQAAFSQWRATLPESARAAVPEQFSIGYVRRRLREAMDIEQILNEEHRGAQRAETQRHNQATEAAAMVRAQNTGASQRRRRPYTEFAATSASYANRAAAADQTVLSLPNIDWTEVWSTGMFGLDNERDVSETTRRVRQAMREFINVRNRRESGAAISNGEWLSARMELFPVPGDGPETIAQKAAARERVIRGLIGMSQGAAQEFNPEMFAPGQRFADMANAASGVDYSDADDDAGDGVVDVSTPEEAQALPPGTVYRTPDGREFTR